MTREEIRQEIFSLLQQSLRESPRGTIQFMNVKHALGSKVGYPQAEKAHRIAREILQELVNNNFLFIGYGDAEGFPFFTLTEYGQECLAKGDILPYDPEGYLKAVRGKIPNTDDLTMLYLSESVSTYNRGFLLSSAAALGVAAEHLIVQLIEAYVHAIGDVQRRKKLEDRVAGKFIYTQYATFKTEFERIRSNLPDSLTKDMRRTWKGYSIWCD